MPLNIGTETFENDILKFYEDNNGDFIIEHKPSGGQWKYDISTDSWVGASEKYSDEDAQDAVAALLNGGTNVSLNYDDANDTLTIDATDTDTQLTNEEIEDIVGGLISGGNNVTATYDDANDTLTIDATDTDTRTDVSDSGTTTVSETTDINFDQNLTVTDDGDGTVTVDAASSTDTTTDVSDSGTTVVSQVEDINFGSNVTVSDDGDGTVTVTGSDTQLTNEEVEDIVNTLVNSDSNLSLSYDDANDTLAFSLSNSITTDSIANDNYNESTVTVSSASGTTDLDLSQANVFRVEAIDNISITFSNVTSTPPGNSVVVYIVESDGGGPYTLSWPTSVVWSGGSAVSEVKQSGNVEISLLTDDGGAEWRGRKSGGGFA